MNYDVALVSEYKSRQVSLYRSESTIVLCFTCRHPYLLVTLFVKEHLQQYQDVHRQLDHSAHHKLHRLLLPDEVECFEAVPQEPRQYHHIAQPLHALLPVIFYELGHAQTSLSHH